MKIFNAVFLVFFMISTPVLAASLADCKRVVEQINSQKSERLGNNGCNELVGSHSAKFIQTGAHTCQVKVSFGYSGTQAQCTPNRMKQARFEMRLLQRVIELGTYCSDHVDEYVSLQEIPQSFIYENLGQEYNPDMASVTCE